MDGLNDDDKVWKLHFYGSMSLTLITTKFRRNGTFVQLNRSQIFRVHNETTPLIGSGCFKLGATMAIDDPERILFRVKKVTKKA